MVVIARLPRALVPVLSAAVVVVEERASRTLPTAVAAAVRAPPLLPPIVVPVVLAVGVCFTKLRVCTNCVRKVNKTSDPACNTIKPSKIYETELKTQHTGLGLI